MGAANLVEPIAAVAQDHYQAPSEPAGPGSVASKFGAAFLPIGPRAQSN